MLWYGVTGVINAVPPLIVYAVLRGISHPYIDAYAVGIYIKEILWWPVVFTWIDTYISNSKFNMILLQNSVTLSAFDPFAGSWIALVTALIHYFDSGLPATAGTWAGIAIWSLITIW